MDNWAQIRVLRAQGMSIRKIAAHVGCAKKTVERALASSEPPSYRQRPKVHGAFDLVEAQVRALLNDEPQIAATVIAERVGWTGSMSWFRESIRKIRPEYLPQDPVDTLKHRLGEQIQCDLMFPAGGIPNDTGGVFPAPVLVMVASYSRFMAACILPTKTTGDLVSGMWMLLEQRFQAIPQHILWDHESGIGRARLTDQVLGFSGALGMGVKRAPPRDPETKGIVERHNRYLETSFFPGRSFRDHHDAQHQLDNWIGTVANQRIHATLKQRPIDRWKDEKTTMRPLPPYPPQTGSLRQQRLPRNYYVHIDSNKYSVMPTAIGKIVTIMIDIDIVRVTDRTGVVLAKHKRVWGKNQVITDPEHARVAKVMRQQLARPSKIPSDAEVETPDLKIYDALSGWEHSA